MDIFTTLKAAPFGLPQEYTFYQDFQIADKVGGKKAVQDTFDSVKENWIDNARAWGEITCALNWRLWDLHETDVELAKFYETLWMQAQTLGWQRGNGDKEYAKTYFEVTD